MKDAAAIPNRYNLSASPDWQALLTHFELGQGFAFIVLLVEDEQGAETCREGLRSFLKCKEKELLELPFRTVDDLKQVAEPLLKPTNEAAAGAMWVARVVPEGYEGYETWREAWREGVARLNQFRNPLRRNWSIPVLVVGAPWLQEVLRENAPDLWSVRTLVACVEPEKIVAGGDLRLTPDTARLGLSGHRPDAELAISEAEKLRSRGGSELAIARLLYRGGLGFVGQYRWPEAKAAFSEALAIRRRANAPLEDQADAAFRLGNVLAWMLDYENAQTLDREALEYYKSSGSVRGEANVIHRLADIAMWRSDLEEAESRYREALRLHRELGDVLGEAHCIQGLGDLAIRRANYVEAHGRYEEALRLFRHAGSQVGAANCIRGLGDVALGRSDYAEAQKRYQEALPLFQQVGSVLGMANCLRSLADTAFRRSDHDDARRYYEEASRLYQQVADLIGESSCIGRLGDIALAQSDQAEAERRYRQALPLLRRAGSLRGEANCILGLGHIALQRSDWSEARQRDEEALRLYRQVGDSLGEANSIQSFGDLALAQSDHVKARQRYDEALDLYQQLGDPYSIGHIHRRLALVAEDIQERDFHVQAARGAWLAIDRPELVKQLDEEFAPVLTKEDQKK